MSLNGPLQQALEHRRMLLIADRSDVTGWQPKRRDRPGAWGHSQRRIVL